MGSPSTRISSTLRGTGSRSGSRVSGSLRRSGRLRHTIDEYERRLDYEIEMIKKMGFPGYLLIVWDFIRYAREEQIPVGPGRGSAAGSLVAWCMRITDVDPIDFELLFERFLNPERISMPDIDVDFCERRRGEVIDYVTRKYGRRTSRKSSRSGR
jgi:DNA polymerase-3 subunit alpha